MGMTLFSFSGESGCQVLFALSPVSATILPLTPWQRLALTRAYNCAMTIGTVNIGHTTVRMVAPVPSTVAVVRLTSQPAPPVSMDKGIVLVMVSGNGVPTTILQNSSISNTLSPIARSIQLT